MLSSWKDCKIQHSVTMCGREWIDVGSTGCFWQIKNKQQKNQSMQGAFSSWGMAVVGTMGDDTTGSNNSVISERRSLSDVLLAEILLWAELCLPPTTSNITIFEYRVFTKVLKVILMGSNLIRLSPFKRRWVQTQKLRADYVRTQCSDHQKPRSEASEETNHTNTLISDFKSSELWENTFLLFKAPTLRYFIMAAWTN